MFMEKLIKYKFYLGINIEDSRLPEAGESHCQKSDFVVVLCLIITLSIIVLMYSININKLNTL